MIRDSTFLFLECPNAILPTPWTGLNNVIANIESTYQSPTREVAVASWQAFVASGDELEVIADPAPTPLPVRFIDMRRLRLALLQMELLDDIDAAILQQSRSAQIEWEYATDVKADHPLVVALATAMDLDIDAIFDLAEAYE